MTSVNDAELPSLLSSLDPVRRSRHYGAALILCGLLTAAAIYAVGLNTEQLPVFQPFVPIVTTIWIILESLTGYLLLSQFIVTGYLPFAVFGGSFALTSALKIAYFVLFPGVFRAVSSFDSLQASAWLWLTWHFAFAAIAIVYVIIDPSLRRKCASPTAVARTLRCTVGGSIGLAGLVIAFATVGQPHVPLLIAGRFTRVFTISAQAIAVLSGIISLATLMSHRRRSLLGLWMSVAIFGEGIDAWLNACTPLRFSAVWYVGKIETTITICAIFIVLLTELTVLYQKVTTQRHEAVRLNTLLAHDLASRHATEKALRESDELFREVEEQSPIGLSLLALDRAFLRVNPALCALTGYSKAELFAIDREKLTHPDDRTVTEERLRQLAAGTTAKVEVEKRYLHKAGHIVWAQLTCSLVRDEAGAPLYIIAQVQEIGTRKAAEQAVRSAERSALASTEAKSRFLAAMSHEIRTPMNGIIGMTELLSHSTLNPQQKEYVAAVLDSGRSLMQILNDILDYSKVEAGKFDLECIDFDLSDEIASVTSLLAQQFQAKGVSFSTQIDANVPATVAGDPGRIRQIIVNLLGNALKFTPAGGSVALTVVAEQDDRQCVRFSIRDTGIGIAPDACSRLFQPFSQVDDSTTRKYGGTGLGLSICKQLAELMGGAIGVETVAGPGSSFWFTVRFARAGNTAAVPDRSLPDAAAAGASLTNRRERILLAEDNSINALLAKRQFERFGFDITIVPNGREAVEALETAHYDVVFMDCHMPTMDGFEATRAIRRLPPGERGRTPIIAMTANALLEDRAACFAAGMDDYVSKPVSLTALKDVLGRWLPQGSEPRVAIGDAP